MRSVLVQLDEKTYRALSGLAPRGHRAEFIRKAIAHAIRREQFRQIRRAYEAQPDSGTDVDDWSNPEEFAI
jgi:predicted transcriptional regulator